MTVRMWGAPIAACLMTMMTGCLAPEPGADDYSSDDQLGGVQQDLLPPPTCNGDDCSGGGGGGGGPPPPPPPGVGDPISSPNASGSYLDASARSYLTSVGVSDPSSVGATMWVNGCRVSSSQGAVTFNSGITHTCVWANLRPGWIIVDINYLILRNDNGRGSASVSSVNGPITVSETQFGSRFSAAIDLAISVGDIEASQKLSLEYQRLNGFSFVFDGTGNNLVATATANGGLFQGSYMDIQTHAQLLRIY